MSDLLMTLLAIIRCSESKKLDIARMSNVKLIEVRGRGYSPARLVKKIDRHVRLA